MSIKRIAITSSVQIHYDSAVREYRVSFREAKGADFDRTAYFTSDRDDAFSTAHRMELEGFKETSNE